MSKLTPDKLLELVGDATQGEWFAGAMNDCVFIVDRKPHPAPTDHLTAGDPNTRFIAKMTDGSFQSLVDAKLICHCVNETRRELFEGETPIDMLLWCPSCGLQHVDAPDEQTPGWTNPPHRSHRCKGCGHIWRVCDRPTNGVAEISTFGKADLRPDPEPIYFKTIWKIPDEKHTEFVVAYNRNLKNCFETSNPAHRHRRTDGHCADCYFWAVREITEHST